MEAFAVARRTAQPGLRIVPNRRGLPKAFLRDGSALTSPSIRNPGQIARDFLVANSAVFRLTPAEVSQLRLAIQDESPEDVHLVFNQTLNGLDVFEGQIKFTLSKTGEVIQVSCGEIAPGLAALPTPRLGPQEAERQARASSRAETQGTLLRAPELVVFPLDDSTARLAFRMFLEVDSEQLYEILVDAEDGKLLFRHNSYVHAAQGRVWTQSPAQGSRQLVAFPDAWLPAGGAVTIGNNVDAYIDADGNDKPDSTNTAELQNGRALSTGQLFDFAFGDGTVGADPRQFQAAAVTNIFYFVNVAHDFYYNLGFTEAAGNFQANNFGKGGTGGDAVLAEAQYGGEPNNASFGPTPEGIAPRIHLGLFTGGTSSALDDLDTDYDGQIVIHEYGHGVSNRLVGGGTSTTCLDQIQSGGMGEGWSDYFAISYFNNPVLGAYTSHNAEHGLRRQSYEGYTFTYEDIGNSGYEVHDDGEIWAATLWDLRKSLGQAVADRLVLSGLKGTPCNPSMTDGRDAILSADLASNGGANRAAIWTVFAKHGLGYSSSGVDGWVGTGTVYNAAYDKPPDLQSTGNPKITSNPLLVSSGAGLAYLYTVSASNPNAGVLNFALDSGPPGMTVGSTGAVSWTVSFTAQRVKITVTDGKGGKVVHGYLAKVFTHLSPGTAVNISGSEDSIGYAWIDVPAGLPVLQVTLRNGVGDADLAVADPHRNYEYSENGGNNETLTLVHPIAGRWQVEVRGYDSYAGVFLTASLDPPTLLSPNSKLTGLAGVDGSETLYRVSIPAGASSFNVSTTEGTGDVDLFLKYGSPATCSYLTTTACEKDQESAEFGNTESITVGNPAAGDWYIDLSAYEGFDKVTLTTALVIGPPQPDLTISKTHSGNFSAGQTGAYTIAIANSGAGATTAAVTVVDSLPAGLTGTAIAGTGWSCVLATLTCTRSDVLAPAAAYPPITVTVSIAANAPASLTNTATVSGGGESNTTNDTARDVTVIAVSTTPKITLVANAFGDTPLIAPNMWVEIKGSNLAPDGDVRFWSAGDFVNSVMPTRLDGISVKVNGKSAYVYLISPTQINILTPPDALPDSVEVQVTFNGVLSNVFTAPAQAQSLSFFEFVVGGRHYVYGRHTDGGVIGPNNLIPGLTTTPVKPGELVYVAATGFGPTDVPVISGAVTQAGNLPQPFPSVKVGGSPATVSFAGLVGVGTVAIFFTVPNDAPDGDLALTATYNGLSIQPNLLITVLR